MYKSALFAIALSPFILNAQLREDLYDSSFDDELDETAYMSYEEEMGDDNFADASYDEDQSYDKRSEDDQCRSPFHVMHAGVRHTEARGVGYHDGYTTIEGFGIYNHNDYFMPFLDLRGHVFNNGKLAGNVGIGERSVLSSINHILGIYLYYDVRQENHSFTVNQLSPGIELLGKRMEYRVNGYFPVGGNRSHKYGYAFDSFDKNNILLKNKQKFAMKGGDAEVGAHLTQSTKYDLYAGAGPYYFSASHTSHSHHHGSAWGGKVRLLGRYKEYISLEASYSYDRIFRNIVQGSVAFSYPFGGKLKRKGASCPQKNDLMLSRAAFAPYRFEIPVVRKMKQTSKAINPATGKPWQVWFVNNTSSSAGTYQSPFPTLVQAQNASAANDMIYVFPGNGTTAGMDMGIVLKDGQRLFGSGISHRINTTRGKMTLPAFSKTAPQITNTASVVTLANGNEISGMNLLVQTGNIGIDGTAGINGVTIDHNLISGNVHQGIVVLAAGNVAITNNQLTSPTDTFTGSHGIEVDIVAGGFAKVNISSNMITGYSQGIHVEPASSSSTGEIKLSNNTISDFNANGIICVNGMTNSPFQITGNTVFNTVAIASAAIRVDLNLTTNPGSYIFEDNNIVTTTASSFIDGIQVQMANLPTGSAVPMLISRNNIQAGSGGGDTGINLVVTGNGTICTSITGNQISLQAPSTFGIKIRTPGTGSVNIDDFSGNIAPAISVSGNVNLVAPNTCSQ